MSRNYDLTGIAPQNVWKYFYEISQIPRNSGDKQRITDYLMDFCKKHGLLFLVDCAQTAGVIPIKA